MYTPPYGPLSTVNVYSPYGPLSTVNVYSTLWPIVNHECLLDPPYAVGTVENVLSAHRPPPYSR